MKHFQHSNPVGSDRLCPGDNFNNGVSTLKHLKGMPGADSVKKKGHDLNGIDTKLNKISVMV